MYYANSNIGRALLCFILIILNHIIPGSEVNFFLRLHVFVDEFPINLCSFSSSSIEDYCFLFYVLKETVIIGLAFPSH